MEVKLFPANATLEVVVPMESEGVMRRRAQGLGGLKNERNRSRGEQRRPSGLLWRTEHDRWLESP